MSLIAATSSHAVVDLYVPNLPSYWGWALLRSQTTASSIYAEIGVNLRFRAAMEIGRPSERVRKNRKILLAFWESTPPDFHPGAMAFARPYDAGSCLTIFLDRIQPMLRGTPEATGALLGHVLAHEIGHILQGISRHSEEGLMKARWSDKEVRSMRSHPLLFTPYDAKLIHEALSDCRGSDPPVRQTAGR